VSPDESRARADGGEGFAVRLAVPASGTVTLHDVLRGDIEFGWENVDAQVLMKRDGMPTYHLANVVDDHLMGITHVIRGEEWISSAPKHILLYNALGWQLPVFCHLPLLRNPDRSKLSKRRNPTSILFYRDMGYLPEALLNYLGTMAWSHPRGLDKLSLAEMVSDFSLSRMSLGGPVFDVQKLSWLNSQWIRDLAPVEFIARVQSWRANSGFLLPILDLAKNRVERLSDLEPLLGFFFQGRLPIDAKSFAMLRLPVADAVLALESFLGTMDLVPWERAEIESQFRRLATAMNIKLRELLPPFYLAVTGSPQSVPLFDAMELLGRDMSRARLRWAADLLGESSAPSLGRREAIVAALQPVPAAEET
jgi:glutamyl-tRNA synthetase